MLNRERLFALPWNSKWWRGMDDHTGYTGCIGRRALLCGGAAACAGFAVQAGGTDPALHMRILDLVRRKYTGTGKSLTLLAPQGSDANLGPILSAFYDKTKINVSLESVPPDEVNTELALDRMLGSAKYDVALPATYALPDLVSAQAIEPLDHLARQFEPQGFRTDIIYHIGDTVDDQLFGFQTDGDAYLMFYNKGMIEEISAQSRYSDLYGVSLDVPRTWEELDRQMAFFHAPDEGRVGGILFRTPSYAVWEWWVRFHAKGNWPFSPDMEPQIDTANGVAATEEMIRASESLVEGADSMGLFDNWRRFAKGDVYANIGWGGTQKFLNAPGSEMRGRMVYGPTPGGVIDGVFLSLPYFNWGWNYVVSAASKQPELAYLFSLFAASPRMSTLSVGQRDGFFDPFRPEHYDDPSIIDAYSEPFLRVHRQAMQNAIPDLYLKGQSDYMHALADGLDAALRREITPEAAMRRIAQRWELVTSRAGRDGQVRRWVQLRSKYPLAARQILRDV